MEFNTFHAAYATLLKSVVGEPAYRNSPRGFPSTEQIGVHYRLRQARQRIPLIPARNTNIVFNFAEALWYLSGRDDLEFIAYYAPSMRKYSADGRRLTGTAYGRAIFTPPPGRNIPGRPNQWDVVVDQLRDDADSKRAVLQTFRSEELTIPANPDVSCTLGLQFLLRDRALHAVGFMRANDAYRGMVSDVFSFTILQEMMARQLGVHLGEYIHIVGSLHVYDSDRKRVDEVLADPAAFADPVLDFPAMPEGDNWPFVHEVLRYEEALRQNRLRLDADPGRLGLPDYWIQVVLLLELYRCYRREQTADEQVAGALSPLNRWLVNHWRSGALLGALGVCG